MVSDLKEELLPNKKHQVKVRCWRGAKVEDMFYYVKPILKRKPDYVVLHVFCTLLLLHFSKLNDLYQSLNDKVKLFWSLNDKVKKCF